MQQNNHPQLSKTKNISKNEKSKYLGTQDLGELESRRRKREKGTES
jgi:hypothetical protein